MLYQRAGGHRLAVDGRYVLTGDTLRFHIGSYDRSRAPTIDPLLYSTLTASSPPTGSARASAP